jgi:NTP pyrophosphatase (non-canonical NTP hydrolase)
MISNELHHHLLRHLEWAPPSPIDRLRYLALALAGEAGELANAVKKEWRDGDNHRDAMVSEIADTAHAVHASGSGS